MADFFYVTTPIYYVNALPHLGTFYTTTVADAFARYHRARGHETFFLTGTDEHGQKIERIAREHNQTPQDYCDGVVAKFKEVWGQAGFSYDRFIRTTDADHRAAVEAMWQRMTAQGDIYKADYDAMYCVGCEGFKTEEEVIEEGGAKVCPLHHRPVERVREENYFFRLSRYADRLLALYQQPGFVRPESRKNEVVEVVRAGLKDLSISRATVKWGIPVPKDPAQVIYVWLDALTNYISALGGPESLGGGRAQALWGASTHLIAKDILRFHAVYWPAILMSAGLPPPRAVLCHGYLTVKGQKISKSLPATRVDPSVIISALGADALRYFVLREYTLGNDGDFAYEALFQRYESDLGNDLGNLANRTIAMARRMGDDAMDLPHRPMYSGGDPLLEEELVLRRCAQDMTAATTKAWDDMQPSRALEATFTMIRAGNVYLDRTAPWKLKQAGQLLELRAVLATTCELIRRAALMVAPAMPQAARELLRQVGRAGDEGQWPDAEWGGWPGGRLAPPSPIFPRLEVERQKQLLAEWTHEGMPAEVASPPLPAAIAPPSGPPAPRAPSAPPAPVASPSGPPGTRELTIDDFAGVDLRSARVVAAEAVPKTDKLLKLVLDLGSEQRTVISGIAGAYAPSDLVGRTVLYLANLKPAKIRGVLSQGMILAADSKPLALAGFDREVPPGTRVK